MVEDWVILMDNKIINIIRWDGNVEMWKNPPETILVKSNELDFSTIISDEEAQILTDF